MKSKLNPSPPIETGASNYCYLLFLCLYALAWSALLSHPFNAFHPNALTADNDIYNIVSQGLISGKKLYADIWDHKGPLLYLFYYLPNLLSPKNFWGLIILQALPLALTLHYTRQTATLFLPKALSSCCMLLVPLILGDQGANPTQILLGLQMASLYYFIRKHKKSSPLASAAPKHDFVLPFLCVCATITLLTKFNICAYWGPFIIYELYSIYSKQGRRACFKQLGGSILLSAIPCLVSCIIASPLNTIESYFLFNLQYGSSNSSVLSAPNKEFFENLLPRFCIFTPLMTATPMIHKAIGVFLAGLFIFAWPDKRKDKALYIVSLCSALLIFIASFKGSYCFRHYYASLHPFYLLSIISLMSYIHQSGSKNSFYTRKITTIYLLINAAILVVFAGMASSLHRYIQTAKSSHEEQQKIILTYCEGAKDVLVLSGSPLQGGIYRTLGLLPPMTHFYMPAITEEKFPFYRKDSEQALHDKAAEFVIIYSGTERDKKLMNQQSGYKNIYRKDNGNIQIYQRCN